MAILCASVGQAEQMSCGNRRRSGPNVGLASKLRGAVRCSGTQQRQWGGRESAPEYLDGRETGESV